MNNAFCAIPHRWIDDIRLQDRHVLLLMSLMRYVRPGKLTCFPSQTTLALHMRKSRQTVNKTVRELVELGYIKKTWWKRKSEADTSCEYEILELGTFFNQNDDKSTNSSDIRLSNEAIPSVASVDTNNNKLNPTLSKPIDISSWEPNAEVVSAMNKEASSTKVQGFIKRFIMKIKSIGYQYADYDQALLDWWESDKARLLAQKHKSPSKGVSATPTRPAPQESLFSSDFRDLGKAMAAGDAAALPEVPLHAILAATACVISNARGSDVWSAWLSKVGLCRLENGALELSAPSAFHLDYVRKSFGDDIERLLSRAGLMNGRLRYA